VSELGVISTQIKKIHEEISEIKKSLAQGVNPNAAGLIQPSKNDDLALQDIIVQLREISAVTSTINGIHKNQSRMEEAIMKITNGFHKQDTPQQESRGGPGSAQKESLSKTMTQLPTM
jgi:hypothetical protein